MTDLSSIKGGGVVRVQSGNVLAKRSGQGASGVNRSFVDVTLPNELNTSRPIAVYFDGVFANADGGYDSAALAAVNILNSTAIRIQSPYDAPDRYFVGTWTVIEYA